MTFTQEHSYTHISSIPLIAFLACVLKKSAPAIGKPFVTLCEIALQKDGCLKLPLLVSPRLLNLYAENIMKNAGLQEAQAGIRLPEEISIISDMQMTPPLWQKVKRNQKASR